jgi:iron complex transport system substrate-binding protein
LAMGKNLMVVITVMVLLSAGVLGALVLMNPTPEDTSVSVSIKAPGNGATVTGVMNVSASVASAKSISYATLRLDGTLLGNRSLAPFFWLVNTTHIPEGQHVLNITALNSAGKRAQAQITVTVNNGGTTVGILSPNNQSKVKGSVTISPQVVSPRSISYLSCVVDGIEIGNVSSVPNSFQVNTTAYANGNHEVKVAVRDELGLKGLASITVFFDNPFTIKDDREKVISFDSTPQRIICLGSSFTEILFAVGADAQVAGVDNSSTYPAAAASKAHVGGSSKPSMEVIASLSPDCIIVWSYVTMISTFEANGYKVVAYNPGSIRGVEKVIGSVGNLTGRSPQAQALVADMETRIKAIQDKVSNISMDQRPDVYFELAPTSTYTNSVGPGTIANELITLAGGRNIYGNATIKYPHISNEYVIGADPDIIIVEDASPNTNTMIAARPGWNTIHAVPDDIFRINGRTVSSTPRLVDALEQMMEWFYPSLVLK